MIKRALILLTLILAADAVAQQPDTRVIGLVTQDKNGLFLFMAIATPKEVKASATQLDVKDGLDTGTIRYPRELFDKLWEEAKTNGMSEFLENEDAPTDQDLEPAKNYLVTIGNGPGGDKYKIPKCSASPVIVAFVQRLANGMLPEGSPGLYEPCPPANAGRPK